VPVQPPLSASGGTRSRASGPAGAGPPDHPRERPSIWRLAFGVWRLKFVLTGRCESRRSFPRPTTTHPPAAPDTHALRINNHSPPHPTHPPPPSTPPPPPPPQTHIACKTPPAPADNKARYAAPAREPDPPQSAAKETSRPPWSDAPDAQ